MQIEKRCHLSRKPATALRHGMAERAATAPRRLRAVGRGLLPSPPPLAAAPCSNITGTGSDF